MVYNTDNRNKGSLNLIFRDLKQVPKKKPNENYQPYHLPTYSTLLDVENYRFVADVIRLFRDARAKMTMEKDRWELTRNLAIFALSYLTASRSSETIELKANDIMIYKNELGKYFVRVTMPNKKNKNAKVKYLIFPYNFNRQEFKIVKLYLKYYIILIKPVLNRYNVSWKQFIVRSEEIPKNDLENIESELQLQPMFVRIGQEDNKKYYSKASLSRQYVNKIFNKYIGHNPHFFRKLRATHLYAIYGFRLKQLQKYMGHANIKSSTPYTYIDPTGVENNFIETDPK